MNLFVGTPEWLIAILCALVIPAGVQDFLQLRISNLFPIGVIVAALVGITMRGWSFDVWENFAIFAALLAIGTLLFASGFMGGEMSNCLRRLDCGQILSTRSSWCPPFL